MVEGQSGKGDKYRPVDQKKWNEGWKKAFDEKYSVMQKGGVIDKSGIPHEKETEENE